MTMRAECLFSTIRVRENFRCASTRFKSGYITSVWFDGGRWRYSIDFRGASWRTLNNDTKTTRPMF